MKIFIGIIIGIALVILLVLDSKNTNNLSQTSSYSSEVGISVSDFQIISFNPRWENGSLRAIGEIKNNGKLPGSPKVEVIARNIKGELIASESFWPNSINNIPPGGTCGIAYPITEDTRAKSADIKIIGVDIFK